MTMEITGMEELLAKLRRATLSPGRVIRDALRAGSQPLVNLANQRAPEALIRIEVKKTTRTHVIVDVGFPDDKWYWRFLETGATAHEIQGNPLVFEGREGTVFTFRVRHPGMAARPFLRNSYDDTRGQVEQIVMDYIVDYLVSL